MSDRLPAAHRELPENARGSMAKADLRKAEMENWRTRIGSALRRALSLNGWSLKEFAGAVDRDPRQCARWLDGSERPQLDVVFAVEELRYPLVQALGELAGADVVTTITVRRPR
jgi:hypothetical protein